MPFALIAELPLGVYRAHRGGGETDPFPTAARLYGALVCAAAQGTRATRSSSGGLEPCADDLRALEWLERNPPDGLALPGTHVNQAAHVRYRRTGTIPREGSPARWQPEKMAADDPEGSVAVDGPFAWTWAKRPRPPIADALGELTADVSHIGTGESPVRLRLGDVEPDHELDPDADLWDVRGHTVEVPTEGRYLALAQLHLASAAAPRLTEDRHGTGDAERRPPLTGQGQQSVRYVPVEDQRAQAPWSVVLLLGLSGSVPPAQRVRWAVAVHRALIAMIGEGAPAIATGADASGPRPANRLAVQLLDRGLPSVLLRGPTTAALLLPHDIAAEELRIVGAAARQLRQIRGPGGRTLRVEQVSTAEAREFWDVPAPGIRRLWRTEPAAVPDTRGAGSSWSLSDAAALSVALVFRDLLGIGPGRGQEWQRRLVSGVATAGLEVRALRPIREGDLGRFVHRINPSAVVRPYEAVLDLGALVDHRTLLAIGQSRHLGGGLLVPVDVLLEG